MRNLTAVLYGARDLRLESRPIPEPRCNEVLLKMGWVGVSASDMQQYIKRKCTDRPIVVGHEASGTVEKVGSSVTTLNIGDRVAIEPGIPCMQCAFCRMGRYNLCQYMKFCATPPTDGVLRQYYCHPATFCFKLPPRISLEEGALIEPLAVGVHACKKGGVKLGSFVLVIGAGMMGLMACIVARSMGAYKIIVTGTHETGLTAARVLGANFAIKVNQMENTSEITQKIVTLFGYRRPDVTIDCAGSQSSVTLGLEATESGGTLVLVGYESDMITVPLIPAAAIREISIKGAYHCVNDFPAAVSLIASGEINVKQLITHKYCIKNSAEAFNSTFERRGATIKSMIYCTLGQRTSQGNTQFDPYAKQFDPYIRRQR